MSRDLADPEAMARYERMVPRRVWAALEYDGPAWTAWLAETERRAATSEVDRKIFELPPALRSRWCAVDAARDVETLERKYPDRRRIAIVRAYVGTSVEREAGQAPHVAGMLFLETSEVGRLLEVGTSLNLAELALTVSNAAHLPAFQRTERERRRAGLRTPGDREAVPTERVAGRPGALDGAVLDWSAAVSTAAPMDCSG